MAKVALAGNPNSGKTTLFNALTGEQQKVGNYPGITVEKVVGTYRFEGLNHQILDLPGAYSLHPTSEDERVASSILLNPDAPDYPDAILYVLDVDHLEQQLLMLSQIIDLGIPTLLVLTMSDEWDPTQYDSEMKTLEKKLGIPVVSVSGLQGKNLESIGQKLQPLLQKQQQPDSFYQLQDQEQFILKKVSPHHFHSKLTDYGRLLILEHSDWLPFLGSPSRDHFGKIKREAGFNSIKSQVHETMARFDKFSSVVQKFTVRKKQSKHWTDFIDRWVSHPYLGPIIFFLIMLFVFQAIFSWATYPMDGIEWIFQRAGSLASEYMPDAWYTSLLTDGILAGLGGVLVFIPQIAILFFLIGLLEEVGYMSRAVYLFDKFMSRFGLNGRSVVAMISGGACAIPAIMSTRTIANTKERLLTIFVTPFIACSARIPVYIVLVGFVVPEGSYWGPLNLQGIVFMGLYLFGIVAALGSSLIMRPLVSGQTSGFLMIELPDYRSPQWTTVWKTIQTKTMAFVREAGRIIFMISIVLWFLASYGPSERMAQVDTEVERISTERELTEEERENLIASKQLEASYAGLVGQWMEPAIRPLGYDWKIGIALLTSFAAREVFVGTMATIYSIGDSDSELKIRDRMAQEVNPQTGEPRYNLATSMSLLIFFALAMQCMSTIAVVKKETGSWKWPLLQFIYMTGLAYILSFLTYQILS